MAFHGLKIAHVSDLHNSHLWKQAIKQLQKAQPDIICITGDIVDVSRTDVDVAFAFCAEAVKIAPCYYVTGNHELGLNSAVYEKLISGLKALGVSVLNNEAVTLEWATRRFSLLVPVGVLRPMGQRLLPMMAIGSSLPMTLPTLKAIHRPAMTWC
jgi:predicted MPP superfamily phosphohydrolase